MDAFMASLIHDDTEQTARPVKHRPAPPKQQPKPATPPPQAIEKPSLPARRERQDIATEIEPTARKNGTRKLALATSLLILAAIAVTAGAFKFLPQLSSPSSPFDQALREEAGIPLYYPTKLPAGYKMELGSITQPESGIILYAISDDSGQRINITLQKQPANINLEPLHATFQNARDISTQFGSVKIGTTEEGLGMANILTGQTWVIISGNPATLNDATLTEVINGLKA